jgi:hypothetical protein
MWSAVSEVEGFLIEPRPGKMGLKDVEEVVDKYLRPNAGWKWIS